MRNEINGTSGNCTESAVCFVQVPEWGINGADVDDEITVYSDSDDLIWINIPEYSGDVHVY